MGTSSTPPHFRRAAAVGLKQASFCGKGPLNQVAKDTPLGYSHQPEGGSHCVYGVEHGPLIRWRWRQRGAPLRPRKEVSYNAPCNTGGTLRNKVLGEISRSVPSLLTSGP